MPTTTCLPTAELVDQLVELARLDWAPGATAAAAERFGWTPVDDGSWAAAFATNTGHYVVPDWFAAPLQRRTEDEECHIPFCYYYEADDFDQELAAGGLSGNIDWLEKHHAQDPEWRFDRDADRAHFDAQWLLAVTLFTRRLGAPEVTARDEERKTPWHYAAWRCGANALVVGQCTDSGSYDTFEQALVWIAPYPADRPFPDAGAFDGLIEC
ncbi:hypothetical protein ABZ553_28745 [Streptomyces sparsogenes]|uniref:hypothetical protein n=1 Tax=Streptomyces sparsogenes TaxID=67365 RepID=UPI003406D3D2